VGKPVTVTSEPTSPETADAVQVTPAPPRTTKFDAVPSEGATVAAKPWEMPPKSAVIANNMERCFMVNFLFK
jgi:hypothetical protein